VTEDPHLTITYRSGLAAYQESWIRGEFVGRSWNGSGYTNPEAERFDPAQHPAPQAFWVELDGQLLRSHWEWAGLAQLEIEDGIEAIVELRHTVRPVVVRVHTRLDGTPVMTRWLEIENTSDRPAALAAAYPWSGVLQTVTRQIDDAESPYSVGTFIDSHWGNEGNFDWRRLPYAGYRIDGRYRRDRHRQPFFVVRNHRTGDHFVGTLAWSGGFAFEFDVDDGQQRGSSRLWFRAGPDAPAPLRVLAPGETVTTPEMHLGMVIGDLDACIQALHDHLRKSVFLPSPEGRAGLVAYGIGPEQEITPEAMIHEIDTAASVGAEVFILDASWSAPPYSRWWSTVGDWHVNLERFPEGLTPLREYVHGKSMLFGLWMDAERIGTESRVAQEHPDWLAQRYDGERELGGMIDLTKPEVADWMESEIDRLITEYELDLFRLDYNVGNIGSGGQSLRSGYVENAYHRYYEALYGAYARLAARHPEVIFQNCASGGARADIGMIRTFEHSWVTDWQIGPRSFSITNGMSMAVPPERMDRLAGMGQSGQRTAELDFQLRLTVLVHPTLAWFHLQGARPNPAQLARVRHAVEIYKDFVRPFQRTSRIYHHTPVVQGYDPSGWGVLELAVRDPWLPSMVAANSGWGVLELASEDGTRAIAGLFRLSDPAAPEYVLRLRGLDVSRRYRVTFDNSGRSCELDGFTLCHTGISIRLETALTSELLLIEALE
jgi:alpha-galactosidase